MRPLRAAQRRRLVTRGQRGEALPRQPKCQASATRAQVTVCGAASPTAPGAQWLRARRVAAWRRRLPAKRHLLSRPLRAAREPSDAAKTVAARGGCGAAVPAQETARCGAVRARRGASAKTLYFRAGPARALLPNRAMWETVVAAAINNAHQRQRSQLHAQSCEVAGAQHSKHHRSSRILLRSLCSL